MLPCYVGNPEPSLSRVLPRIPSLVTELWIITHESLKGTARVRAFMDLVGEGLWRRLAVAGRAAAGEKDSDANPLAAAS